MSHPLTTNRWRTIVPHDGNDMPEFAQNHILTSGVYVGVTGNVVAVMESGETATFVGVPAGATLNIAARRINSTNTTATTMLALYQA